MFSSRWRNVSLLVARDGGLIGTVMCCFCTSESMHRLKRAASRLRQGLMLDLKQEDDSIKKKKKKTRGAILYGLMSQIEKCSFHTPQSSKRIWRKTESELRHCSSLAGLRRRVVWQKWFRLQVTQQREFSIHQYWRAAFIYLITVCFNWTFSC